MMKALKIWRRAYECIKGLKNILEKKALDHMHTFYTSVEERVYRSRFCASKPEDQQSLLRCLRAQQKIQKYENMKTFRNNWFYLRKSNKWKYVS